MNRDEIEAMLDLRFGVFIRRRREYINRQESVIARYAGVSEYRLIELENGNPNVGVTMREIIGIAKALDLPVKKLIEIATGEKYEDKKKDSSKKSNYKSQESYCEEKIHQEMIDELLLN